MSFVPVVDRSSDGLFQVACEGCGVGLDWMSGVELTAMAIKGYRHFCFDCDSLEAERVPRCFFADNGVELLNVEVWFPNGRVEKVPVRGAVEGLALVLFSQNSNTDHLGRGK